MADLSITAANVTATSSQPRSSGIAGTTITAGQALYVDATDSNKLKPADANNGVEKAAVAGIALNGAASGQPVVYQTGGTITIGATVGIGAIYVQSRTPGGICPAADLLPNDYVTIIGVGTTATTLSLLFNNTGSVTGLQQQ
jgi:hypothetical protein